jgi:hypothetical protein
MTAQAQHIAERIHPMLPLNPRRGGPASTTAALPDEDIEEHASTLEVMIVHEDMPTGLRAKHALDHLADEPGVKLHFVVKLWTFKMLSDPLLHGHAVNDARDAHILFLSMHGHLELPSTVSDLINHWVPGREERPIALVVSIDESLRETAVADATLEYLRTKTEAGGVDLFPHFGVPPSAAWNWVSQGVPFQDDARQTALGIPSCTRRLRDGDSMRRRPPEARINRGYTQDGARKHSALKP